MKSKLPTITLCMIVKNDSKTLPLCINSVKPFVDEIIVVDTGSKDKSGQIARDLGCKVFNFVWNNNYSSARNFALQQATGDWVFNLDADCSFNSSEKNVLKETLQETDHLGLMIEENFIDIVGQTSTQDKLLIFRNNYGFLYQGSVFENPMDSIKKWALKNKITVPYGKIENCCIDLIDPQRYCKKLHYRLSLVDKAIKKEPDNYHYKYNQVLTLKYLGMMEEFEKALLNAVYIIEQKKPKLSESVVGLWSQFGDWIIHDNNFDHVESFYKSAKVLNEKTKWSDIRLVWPYVKISIKQGNYNKAIKDLTFCIKQGIVPAHVSLSKEELVTPVYQLLKLINEEKDMEDFVAIVLELEQLLDKSGLTMSDLLAVLKSNDKELYNSILDILGAEDKNSANSKMKKSAKSKNVPFISLCMIIKNEKDNLPRCLNSVKDLVDEIIIVDTGSKDDSIKIAKDYKSNIYYHKWNDDFSKARNFGLQKANGKWILFLDADEELHLATRDKIIPLLKKTKADGLNVWVRKHQPQDDVMRYIDEQRVRFFRNYKGFRFSNRLHSQVITSIAEQGGSFADSPVIINNYGPQQKNVRRHRRNIPLLNEGLKEHPKDAYMLFKLAETYKSLNQWDKAKDYYTKAISNPKGSITSDIKELIYLRLAQISLAKDEYKATKKYASACLRFNAQNAMAKYIMGVTYMHLGDTQSSLRIFRELRATQKIHGLDLSEVENYLDAVEKTSDTKILN